MRDERTTATDGVAFAGDAGIPVAATAATVAAATAATAADDETEDEDDVDDVEVPDAIKTAGSRTVFTLESDHERNIRESRTIRL